jgi:hypothetical protein
MNVALALAKNYSILAKARLNIKILFLQLKLEAINVLKMRAHRIVTKNQCKSVLSAVIKKISDLAVK